MITFNPAISDTHAKKGPWSLRIAEIDLLLLSGYVGSVWNGMAALSISFYIRCKWVRGTQSACFTLFVAIFVYALKRPKTRMDFTRGL